MLKTNSKKARENVRNYIMTDSDYVNERIGCDPDTLTQAEVLNCIRLFFSEEYGHDVQRFGHFGAFERWASGLALGGLFLYYYNVSAVDTLGDILEETEDERNRYSEAEAERLLTYLIYREVFR